MNSKLLHPIVIVSLLLALFVLSGCTVIGLAVGSSADRAARRKATGSAARAASLTPGWRVTLTDINGREMTGVYRGLRQRPASEYVPLYEQARAGLLEATSPRIGDTLAVALKTGKTVEASLAGFGLQHLWLKSPARDSLTRVASSDIAEVTDSRGVAFDTPSLSSLMACDGVPSIMTLQLRRDSENIDIPGNLISQVRVHVKPHYWLIGGCIGLALDAVLVATVISAASAWDLEYGGGGLGGGGGSWY
jgi:hypothetical protein